MTLKLIILWNSFYRWTELV